jgi:hypothetical protein
MSQQFRSAEVMSDKRSIACNYAIATRVCSEGALCFVLDLNPGSGGERLMIRARSRGGKWVTKWEARHRLHNFRFKTVPPSHPQYDEVADFSNLTEFDVARLGIASNEERGERLPTRG